MGIAKIIAAIKATSKSNNLFTGTLYSLNDVSHHPPTTAATTANAQRFYSYQPAKIHLSADKSKGD